MSIEIVGLCIKRSLSKDFGINPKEEYNRNAGVEDSYHFYYIKGGKKFETAFMVEKAVKDEISFEYVSRVVGKQEKPLKKFPVFHYFPRGFLEVPKLDSKNDFFKISKKKIKIDFRKWRSTNRRMMKKPLWVFRGESGIGKTFLSSQFKNLNVFELDSCKSFKDIYNIELRDFDVLVIGNKNKFSKKDWKDWIDFSRKSVQVRLIMVNFKYLKKEAL